MPPIGPHLGNFQAPNLGNFRVPITLVFIDDATSSLMQLRFVASESTGSYLEALQGYLATHGCPVAFYSDEHSVFRINRDAQDRDHLRQLQSG
jgi:hypothetical protein